jgi:hypothetical protein
MHGAKVMIDTCKISHVLLYQGHNISTNVPQCYVTRTLLVFFFNVFLTVHLRIILVSNQLDACAGGKIERNEMGRACGAYGGG